MPARAKTVPPQGSDAEQPSKPKCSAPSKVIGTKHAFLLARNDEWLGTRNKTGTVKIEVDLPFEKDLDVNKPDPDLSLLDTPQELTDAECCRFKEHRKRISQWFCNHNNKLLKNDTNEVILDLINRALGAKSVDAPRKRQAAQIFLREYQTEVYAIFTGCWEEELANAKAASKKPPKKVTILMKVTRELLNEQSQLFCAEIDQMVLDDYLACVAKWESKGKGSYARQGDSPEAYDSALFRSGDYMQPMIRYAGTNTGMNIIMMLYHGKTRGLLGQTWQQLDPTGFDAAATSAARWGRACFLDEECQARVLPVEDGVNTSPSSSNTLLPSVQQPVDVVSVTNGSLSDVAPLQALSHPSTLTPSPRAPTPGSPNPIPMLVAGQSVLSPALSSSTTLSSNFSTYSSSTGSPTTSFSASSSTVSSSTNSPTTLTASFVATSDIGTDFGVDVDFDGTLDDLFELADDFEDGLGDGLGASMGDHNDPSAIIIDDTQAASMVLQSTSSGMASSPPVIVSPAGSPLASATPLTASSAKLPVAEPDLMTMMSAVDGFGFGSLLSLPVVPKPTTAFETPV
ncbi:hypothetical protein JAAARDRAFT_198803 [Jaapia argillacea MUCL 33604]|uniref:Uncharacterized protein n=1 Tax=Jaapia argillacea MUCL 33604 TaxID=933084 RepID=A0A067PDQ3_9AGAM|nr:hypothetical protein JAAARDRAFT_198803 [Jaapia argillacea MUCL 33604]